MSTELINRITVKKDGVYLSSHSSNDTAPFHSWRCKSLSEIYAAEGQAGLDREIVCMLYTPSKKIVFNEVNTIPGFTSHSRYPNMMKGIGLSFAEMLDKLIGLYVK